MDRTCMFSIQFQLRRTFGKNQCLTQSVYCACGTRACAELGFLLVNLSPRTRRHPSFRAAQLHTFALRFALLSLQCCSGLANDMHFFDTATLQWHSLPPAAGSGPPPSKRSGLGLAGLGGYLYVFGGQLETGEAVFKYFKGA